VLTLRFKQSGNHAVMGSTKDPKDGSAVAASVFAAVAVYGAFLVFCASQAFLHMRESRRGAISLR
jgi:ribonuclease kappa